MAEKTVTVTVKYGKPKKVTHSCVRSFTETKDIWCPGCGYHPLWIEDELGDYYLGQTLVCPSCGDTGYITWGGSMGEWQDEQVVDAIRDSGERINDE